MGSAVQSSPLTSTLTMRAFLTVFLAALTLLSTTLWLDIPTPSSTERGRLRLSPSLTPSDRSYPARLTEVPSPMLTTDTVCPRLLGSPTLLSIPSPPLSITVLLDIPILWSTARGRLRPSPSTDTPPPELSLTFTTLVSWLPLVSDTLSPRLDTDMSLTPPTSVSAPTLPVSRFLVRWRRSRRVSYDENIRYQ